MGKNENDILNMDFGDFVDLGSTEELAPVTVEEEDVQSVDSNKNVIDNDAQGESSTNEEKNTEIDEELNLNDILSETTEDSGTEGNEESKNTTESDSAPKDTETSSSEPFALVFSRFLKEQGQLSDFDEEELMKIVEEEGEAGALGHLIRNELEIGKGSLKEEYDTFAQEYLTLREKGVDADTAKSAVLDLETISSVTEDSLEGDSKEVEELRKNILTEFYKETTSFSSSRIEKLINRSMDLGDDIEDSKEALTKLKEIRKDKIDQLAKTTEEQQRQQALEYQQTLKNLKDKIDSTSEIIPSKKINKQTKDKLYDMLTKPAKQLESGQVLNGVWAKRAESPQDFDIKLAYLINAGVFDGNFKDLVSGAKTKATEQLEEAIRSDNSFSKRSYKPTVSGGNKQERDSLAALKKIF